MGPLFESLCRPLLKSGLQPLGRYGSHQETISRRPKQMYTLSDTRLEWLGEGLLFKLDSNKCWRARMQPIFKSFPGPLLKSGVGPLARCGNHWETLSRRPEQMYTSSDTILEWPGRGNYLSWTQINARGQNGATIRATSRAITEVRPACMTAKVIPMQK